MTLRNILSTVCAVAVFVAMMAPQTMVYGRPQSVAATFSLWLIVSFGKGLLDAVRECWKKELLLLLFLAALGIKSLLAEGGGPVLQVYASSAVYACILVVIGAYFYRRNEESLLATARCWTLLILAVSMASGLPVMYRNPTIARLQSTGDIRDLSLKYAGQGYENGIGNYFHYTSLAIIVPCCIALFMTRKFTMKIVLAGAFAILALSVILAMFTMATFLVFYGFLASAVVIPFLIRSRYRVLILVSAIAFVTIVPSLIGYMYEEFGAFTFVYDKLFRLAQEVWQFGLSQGDETGRMVKFIKTWESICRYPLFGIPSSGYESYVGGHSSLLDGWAIFGLFGYLPFFLFQVQCTRLAIRRWLADRADLSAFASSFAWITYWICCVFNPMWSVLPVMLIFTDYFPRKATTSAANGDRGVRSKLRLFGVKMSKLSLRKTRPGSGDKEIS